MKIHHLRNATFVIESAEKYILIDPMLSDKGTMPPFARFKHKSKKNPLVSLPSNAAEVLNKVTNCLVTHCQKFGIKFLQHTDHLDASGVSFLKENNIPIAAMEQDTSYLRRQGLNIEATLIYWHPVDFLGGSITAIPALHGHGWINALMANGAGLILQLPNEPSIYIGGDTVYTKDVERAFTEYKPDISVMASGCATLDFGGPILMTMEELITFARHAPGKVMANHLEALNHCPTTRSQLKQKLENNGLLSKMYIPIDGDVLIFEGSEVPSNVYS